MITKIYGFVNGHPQDGDGFCAMALSDRGDFLLEHVVEKADDAPAAVGVNSTTHHDIYAEYAPDGFEVIWVAEPLKHAEVQAAYELNKAMGEQASLGGGQAGQ